MTSTNKELKPSEICKNAGLKSFAELVRITRQHEQTLLRWFKEKPVLFRIVVQGAVVEKQNNP